MPLVQTPTRQQADDQLVERARRVLQEVEQLKAQAVKDGRAEGLKAAEAAVAKAAQAHAQQVQTLLTELESAFGRHLHELECKVADVVWVAVCQLLGEVAAQPEQVASAVHHALAQVEALGPVEVQVNPQDEAIIRASLGNASGAALRVVASREVALGGCRIVTTDDMFDARLETQLALLHQALGSARTARKRPTP